MKQPCASYLQYMKCVWCLVLLLFCSHYLQAQCYNNVYGISSAGTIYSIDLSTQTLTAVSGAAPSANNSNGLSYNSKTNTFYFFANANTRYVFEFFKPGTTAPNGSFTTLSNTGGPTKSIASGCISSDGSGYYCFDTNGNLYYYNIAANSWTTVTTSIKDSNSNPVPTSTTGDIAMDGSGNLYILTFNSSTFVYGVYKITGPIPTVSTSSLTASTVVAPTNVMPNNSMAVGMAFNASHQTYISSSNNNLYLLKSDGTLVPVSASGMTQNITDLASCSVSSALPVNFISFSAKELDRNVVLTWRVASQLSGKNFIIEKRSEQGIWQQIATVAATGSTQTTYSYLYHAQPSESLCYFRVGQANANGYMLYSTVESVKIQPLLILQAYPNPAHSTIYIYNPQASSIRIVLINAVGQVIKNFELLPGTHSVDISALPPGVFVIKDISTGGLTYAEFEKN